ncbi:MAG: hypothetical protein M3364_07425 [Actinomycetota bacterium]|nr:hypothetical protein [Actinomycetota bacterium]
MYAPMGHNRDDWNAEAVLIAFQPWEIDLIARGLGRLAQLADANPARYGLFGHGAEPALAVGEKIDQVLEYQGYGGIEDLRTLVEERHGDEVDASAG